MTNYETYHSNLTRAYYQNLTFNGESITEEEFEALHNLNNLKSDKYYPDPIHPIPDIDNKITTAENNLPSGLSYNVTQCTVGE